ncbi:MAG: FAD/NAD(P)-binding oxidoreductase, partial [Hyphomicrobiaceae bacterium]
MRITRRDFGKLIGAAGAGTMAATGVSRFAIAQNAPKVVVVGGGAGGATAAHFLKKDAPNFDVTLIETNPIYSSSFFSNLYLGGFRQVESLNHGYQGLKSLGIKVVQGTATDVDSAGKTVKVGGRTFPYDKLVLSPGIDIKFDSVPGYSREAALVMPHAYNTALDGKRLLKRQLDAMRDGGVVVIVTPNNPYRCPPGPYERACMIAHYLKTKKPKSKLIILDPKKAFSKQPVFTEAFDKYYKDIIELNLTTEIDDF